MMLFRNGILLVLAVVGATLGARGQGCSQTDVYPTAAAQGALQVLAFGTSVMWGNGLRAKETFRHQLTDWLVEQTGRQVQLITYAHSGALLSRASQQGSIPSNPAPELGLINESLPTVEEQVNCAIENHLTHADLLLVEGCINDVGAERIVYPWTDSSMLSHDTDTWCGHMGSLLETIKDNFPEANVIVVGYYPIVSNKTPFLGWLTIPRLIKHAQHVYEAAHPRIAGQTRPSYSRKEREGIAAKNSQIFYQHAKFALNEAVNAQNSSNHQRFAYAGLPERAVVNGMTTVDPNFSFGTCRTSLWYIPIRLLPFWVILKDHAYWSRQQPCHTYAHGVDEIVCESNAAAHPNAKGAVLYLTAVERSILASTLQVWRSSAPSNRINR